MTLTQAKLAEILGVSQSAISQCSKRGMPTTSVAEARAWRDENLNPCKTKSPPLPPRPPHLAELLAQAEARLAVGDPVADRLPDLRAALRLLPAADRSAVKMSIELWDRLTERVSHATGDCPFKELSDAEAEDVGEFWFAAAAGEVFAP